MTAPLTTKTEVEAQVTVAMAEWLAGFEEWLKDDGLFPGIRGVLELGFRGGFAAGSLWTTEVLRKRIERNRGAA